MKIAVVLFGILNLWLCYGAVELNRPSYENRSYHSKGIDGLIDQLLPLFKDPDLAVSPYFETTRVIIINISNYYLWLRIFSSTAFQILLILL